MQDESSKSDREVLDEILSRLKRIEIKINQLAADTPEVEYEKLVGDKES
jgi:hypothetical protein